MSGRRSLAPVRLQHLQVKSGRRPRRKVLIAPSSRNPYIDSLVTQLGARGFSVDVKDLPNLFVLRGFVGDADVLHLHWLNRFFFAERSREAYARAWSFIAQLDYARRMQALYVVWTCHNLESHENAHPELDRRLRRKMAKLSDAIIVHSESAKSRVVESLDADPRRVTVMRHPHYQDAYPVSAPDEPPPGEGPVFLALGRVRPYKGLDRIVDASVNCRARHRLLIVGEVEKGFDDGKLVTAASIHPHITYRPGALDADEIARTIAMSDVMLPPASDILTSGSLVLAMSLGKACVVPRGSYADGVMPVDGGAFYSLGDGSDLRRTLEKIAKRGSEFDAMGNINRTEALRWNWSSFARDTAAVYQQ